VAVDKLVDEFQDLGRVLICCAEDLGFCAVRVSVLPALKRT
jgi:hypothetical protein